MQTIISDSNVNKLDLHDYKNIKTFLYILRIKKEAL